VKISQMVLVLVILKVVNVYVDGNIIKKKFTIYDVAKLAGGDRIAASMAGLIEARFIPERMIDIFSQTKSFGGMTGLSGHPPKRKP